MWYFLDLDVWRCRGMVDIENDVVDTLISKVPSMNVMRSVESFEQRQAGVGAKLIRNLDFIEVTTLRP